MATSAKTPPICLGKNWIWPCKDKVFAASPEILRRGFFSYQGGMHHPVVSRKKPGCTDSLQNAGGVPMSFAMFLCPPEASFNLNSLLLHTGSKRILQHLPNFTIIHHTRCFSGAQNSITVLLRLSFKSFQCALFHFYLKNSNLLLYLFSLTVFQNRNDTIAMPKCKWPKTVYVA